jgi:hypothetical protein
MPACKVFMYKRKKLWLIGSNYACGKTESDPWNVAVGIL